MSQFAASDTIRILVATDNHVGYNERDPIRGDDSWKSFHECLSLAKERDVDMILLAGDLFHENKPSQKSVYQVMRSLRMNCLGEKPCELEMLSDGSEAFSGAFNHVNYEDPDVNVAIPVFTIHGNHDDPSGPGHHTPLDLLQMAGLINYYGRTPESDNIHVKPVLLQKGKTKLALYGLSNVRDERLFRTFRDGNVKFFQPGTQKGDWFNLMSVHQNRHAHTETGYLPVHFLPDFLDFVVWGHEHECKIEPEKQPECNFHIMQPGSSVATSLIDSESQSKHVAILTIQGTEYKSESIRLKTVRPFIYRDLALKDDKYMQEIAQQDDNMAKVHSYLIKFIDKLILEANEDWLERQREAGEEPDEDTVPPLPLIRVRVDYSAPEGGKYEMENPQRFSNRFSGRVANIGDVVSYHRKRTVTRNKNESDMPDEEVLAQLSIDNVKIGKLVEEFLAAQSLTILPQNSFIDTVGQFVDKDDKDAIQSFIEEQLAIQINDLIGAGEDDVDEQQVSELMQSIKDREELRFAKGEVKKTGRKPGKKRPKPENWDTDFDGEWDGHTAAIIRSDEEGDDSQDGSPTPRPASRGGRGGRGRGRAGKASTTSTRKTAATTKKAPAKSTRAKAIKKRISDDEDEEDNDVVMIDDDGFEELDDDSQSLFVTQSKTTKAKSTAATSSRATKSQAAKPAARGSKASPAASAGRQSKLSFGSSQATTGRGSGPARAVGGRAAAPRRLQEPSEDEISDDDDAFEPPTSTAASKAGGRRR